MEFKKNHYYLYKNKIYRYLGKTTFPSGYTLYYFENDNFGSLTLGEEDIINIVEY